MEWFKVKNIDLSDEELLEKIQEEFDDQWIVSLFSRYIELVYGVCINHFKNTEIAKDVTMEIYQKMHSKVQKHKVDNFKSWLYVLVKNHCLEKLRKDKREKEKFNALPFMHSEETFHPFKEDEKELQLRKLEECMETLKINQKNCVDQFYLQKKSYDQIANEMKLDWNKVRSLIQNGRRNLKICLESK